MKKGNNMPSEKAEQSFYNGQCYGHNFSAIFANFRRFLLIFANFRQIFANFWWFLSIFGDFCQF
jgi:hypothetical protein